MSRKSISGKNELSRRHFLNRSASAVTAAIAFPMVNLGSFQVFAASDRKYSQRAVELIQQSQVIDMLSLIRPLDTLYITSPTEDKFALSDEHLSKLKSSGVNIFHPAVGLGRSKEEALQFIGGWNSFVSQYHEHFVRVDSVSDMEKLKKSDKMGIIFGVQNSEHFRSPDDVNLFYNLGQRVSQLTYNTRNLIGTGSTDRADGGLSDFGVAIIERMNQVGMAVDVSHCGDKTTLDAFDASQKPVLITHSNSRVLAGGHPRCKPDEAFQKMARNGGVVGITGVRQFVRDKEPTDIEHMLDHFDHISKLVGVEYVGIGSDMDPDGYDGMTPENKATLKNGYKASYAFRDKFDTDGFDHPQKFYDLVEGLIRRRYSNADISGILGGNFARVLSEIFKA